MLFITLLLNHDERVIGKVYVSLGKVKREIEEVLSLGSSYFCEATRRRLFALSVKL